MLLPIENILRVSIRNDNITDAQHPEVFVDRRQEMSGDASNLTHPFRSIPQNTDDFDA
jgi:hypothetical protein